MMEDNNRGQEKCKHEHFANAHIEFHKSSQMWTLGFNLKLQSQAVFFQSKASLVEKGNIPSSDLQSSWLQNSVMPLF